MGTRAFVTIKLNDKEVHSYSTFDGDTIEEFLERLKEYKLPLDEIIKDAETRLGNAIYYTLDEVDVMFKEFSESQDALDVVWRNEMPAKHEVLNANTLKQWNVVYPTFSFNSIDVFKALCLTSLSVVERVRKTPLIQFTDEEIAKLKSYSQYIYEIDLNENLWTVSEDGESSRTEKLV